MAQALQNPDFLKRFAVMEARLRDLWNKPTEPTWHSPASLDGDWEPNGDGPEYCLLRGVVYLRGEMLLMTLGDGGGTVFTLPEEYRPAKTLTMLGWTQGGFSWSETGGPPVVYSAIKRHSWASQVQVDGTVYIERKSLDGDLPSYIGYSLAGWCWPVG